MGCEDKKLRIMLLSRCAVYGSKKSKFTKQQEASGFLTSLLGVKSTFEGIPLLFIIV